MTLDEKVREWARAALYGNMSTDNGRLKFSEESLRAFARLARADAFEMAKRRCLDGVDGTHRKYAEACRMCAELIDDLAAAEKELKS